MKKRIQFFLLTFFLISFTYSHSFALEKEFISIQSPAAVVIDYNTRTYPIC